MSKKQTYEFPIEVTAVLKTRVQGATREEAEAEARRRLKERLANLAKMNVEFVNPRTRRGGDWTKRRGGAVLDATQ